MPKVTAAKATAGETDVRDDGSVLIGGPAKKPATGKKEKAATEFVEITVKPDTGWLAALRLELLPDAAHGGRCFRGREGTTVKLAATLKRAGGKPVPLT